MQQAIELQPIGGALRFNGIGKVFLASRRFRTSVSKRGPAVFTH